MKTIVVSSFLLAIIACSSPTSSTSESKLAPLKPEQVSFNKDSILSIAQKQLSAAEKSFLKINNSAITIQQTGIEEEGDKTNLMFRLSQNYHLTIQAEKDQPNGLVILSLLNEEKTKVKETWVTNSFSFSQTGNITGKGDLSNTKEGGKDLNIDFDISTGVFGLGSSEFKVTGNKATLNGTLGSKTYVQLHNLIQNNKDLDTLLFETVEGSENDDVNVYTGRLLRSSGITTLIESKSSIASGGVDLYLAGYSRVVRGTPTVGVHSWCCEEGKDANDLDLKDPAHNNQLEYFRIMLGEKGEAFYYYTIKAADADDIYNMTSKELEEWNFDTNH